MIPLIPCQQENHQKMPLEFIFISENCISKSRELGCVFCCQQSHKESHKNIFTIKHLISEVEKKKQSSDYELATTLIKGLFQCTSRADLKQNVTELLQYWKGGKRFERILDADMQKISKQASQFYQDRNLRNEKARKNSKRKQPQSTFISPILTFRSDDALTYGYELKSPFCVVNSSEKFTTAFTYPPLTKFPDSIEIKVKIEQLTPFWLGIGVSIGKAEYEENSKNHIINTSNGWICNTGKVNKSSVKFCIKDTVTIKWDKGKELIEFRANGQKETIGINSKWNEEVYLCAVLYYKNDSVLILS